MSSISFKGKKISADYYDEDTQIKGDSVKNSNIELEARIDLPIPI